MNIPVRGIQALLFAAFVIHFLAWGMDLVSFYESVEIYEESQKRAYWGSKLVDISYMTLYLAEIAIIEVLLRIWHSLKNR